MPRARNVILTGPDICDGIVRQFARHDTGLAYIPIFPFDEAEVHCVEFVAVNNAFVYRKHVQDEPFGGVIVGALAVERRLGSCHPGRHHRGRE